MENPFKKAVEDNTDEIKEQVSQEETETNVAEENATTEAEEKITENPLQAKYDELNNQYLRLAADFDNYRKRQAQERENLLKYGAENTVKQLIEVLDNFDRGAKAIETVEDCDKVKECFNLAYKNFTDGKNRFRNYSC